MFWENLASKAFSWAIILGIAYGIQYIIKKIRGRKK